MRESEVRALLQAHAGGALCVEYRVHDDGTIVVRPPPARAGLATALASLTAWTPPAEVVDTSPAIERPSVESADAAPGIPAPSTAVGHEVVARVNFNLPDDCRRNRGAVVVGDHPDLWHRRDRADRLVWVPTRTLWRQMVERWRARRAARAR